MPRRQRLILILFVPLTALAMALFAGLLAQPEPSSQDDLAFAGIGYLSTDNAQWLALVALTPLALALAFTWQHEQPSLDYLQPEMFGAFGAWISLANAYAVAFMLPLLGVLPTLEPPIASLAELRLVDLPVNWVALGLITATILFYVWFLFLRTRGVSGMADRIRLPHRRVALLILLAGLAVAVWLFGSLSFALFIIPSTWMWIHIEPHSNPFGKALNVVLAVGGIAPFVMVQTDLTPWQLLLAAAYGVFYPIDVLMFFLLVALLIRFLRLGLSAPYVAPPPLPSQSEILNSLLR